MAPPVEPGAPAPCATREDVRMVEQAIEHRGDGRGVAEEFPQSSMARSRREQRRRALAAVHHDLQEVLGRGVRQLPHSRRVPVIFQEHSRTPDAS